MKLFLTLSLWVLFSENLKFHNYKCFLCAYIPLLRPNAARLTLWVCAQSLRRVRLFVTPWIVALQALPSTGFSRQEYWSGLPFPPPGDLPDTGTEATSPAPPALASWFFTTEPPRKSSRGQLDKNSSQARNGQSSGWGAHWAGWAWKTLLKRGSQVPPSLGMMKRGSRRERGSQLMEPDKRQKGTAEPVKRWTWRGDQSPGASWFFRSLNYILVFNNFNSINTNNTNNNS